MKATIPQYIGRLLISARLPAMRDTAFRPARRRQGSDDCNCGVIRLMLFCLSVAAVGVIWLVMPL